MGYKLRMDIYLICRLVIMNLVSISNGRTPHVPYRDSKLTFLLQVDDSILDHEKAIFGFKYIQLISAVLVCVRK